MMKFLENKKVTENGYFFCEWNSFCTFAKE